MRHLKQPLCAGVSGAPPPTTFQASPPSDCSGMALAAMSVPITVPTEPAANMISSRPVDVKTRLQEAS